MAKDPRKRIPWGVAIISGAFLFAMNTVGTLTRSLFLTIVALPLTAVLATMLVRRHRRKTQQELLKLPTPENVGVLYLRAFSVDDEVASVLGMRTFGFITGGQRITTEIVLTHSFAKVVAPVIAFGEPGEELPDIGAHRVYVQSNEDWKAEVKRWAEHCRVIVVRPGLSGGVVWELEEVLKYLGKRVIVIVTYRPPRQIGRTSTVKPIVDLVHNAMQTVLDRKLPREEVDHEIFIVTLRGELEAIRPGWLALIHGRFSATAVRAAKRVKELAG